MTTALTWILAAAAPYVYHRPFLEPLPLWGNRAWPWLLVPLCAAVALVYKSIKCAEMKRVPREAATLFAWIIGGMVLSAVALTLVVKLFS